MKTLFLFAAMTATCLAGDMDRGLFKVSELADAQAKATEKQKMVAFLMSDPAMKPG